MHAPLGFINGLGIGPAEMGVVLFVFLLLFGAKKLPEIARTLGRFMEEMRRASSEFRHQLHEAGKPLQEARQEINQDLGSLKLESDPAATPSGGAASSPALPADPSTLDYDGLVEPPAAPVTPAPASPAAESAAPSSPEADPASPPKD